MEKLGGMNLYKAKNLHRPDCDPCIQEDGSLIAATLLTNESAISRVSVGVSGSSLERPMIMVLINVSSCTGTSLTILSNKLKKNYTKMERFKLICMYLSVVRYQKK